MRPKNGCRRYPNDCWDPEIDRRNGTFPLRYRLAPLIRMPILEHEITAPPPKLANPKPTACCLANGLLPMLMFFHIRFLPELHLWIPLAERSLGRHAQTCSAASSVTAKGSAWKNRLHHINAATATLPTLPHQAQRQPATYILSRLPERCTTSIQFHTSAIGLLYHVELPPRSP